MLKKLFSLRDVAGFILISLIVFAILSLVSCVHNPYIPSEIFMNDNSTGEGINCDPDTVYFKNTVLPLFVTYCAKSGCHDAGTAEEGVILNSYSNIIATGEIRPFKSSEGDAMKEILRGNMPPQGEPPLQQEQIDKIVKWINQGAKNNACAGCTADTSNVTFSASIKPILDGKCVGCHNSNTANGSVNLTTYDGAKSAGQSGSLLGSVNHDNGYSAMPKYQNKLPSCEIDLIRVWIQHNYPQ